MSDEAVTFEKQDSIGIITLNGSDGKAPLAADTPAALADIRKEVGYGSDINVIVLTGQEEGPFSIGTHDADYASRENREHLVSRHQAAAIIGDFDVPTIAAVRGDAIDQDLELALACDMRVASETAHFGFTQVGKGGIPWDGGTQRLSRLVGKGKALEMILLGTIVDAGEAQKMGLVTRVAPPEAVMPAALEMAQTLASKGPIALRYAKEAILKGMDMTLAQGLRLEADLYFLLHTTEDRTEGINAFREKREPRFKGK
ncbi:MAG: enoyl-CoA hydratase-related protein [Desulfobacterales bacterium]